jgi:hypothetical protein
MRHGCLLPWVVLCCWLLGLCRVNVQNIIGHACSQVTLAVLQAAVMCHQALQALLQ